MSACNGPKPAVPERSSFTKTGFLFPNTCPQDFLQKIPILRVCSEIARHMRATEREASLGRVHRHIALPSWRCGKPWKHAKARGVALRDLSHRFSIAHLLRRGTGGCRQRPVDGHRNGAGIRRNIARAGEPAHRCHLHRGWRAGQSPPAEEAGSVPPRQ